MLPEKIEFTKAKIDEYLKELAKEFRKTSGSKASAEIILIGGASIVINYNFRNYTYDNDAEIRATSSMKDAINRIADRYSLPNDWINSDFKNTKSYSPKIREVSQHYRTYSNVVDIRTVSDEYLIAMKLMSGRTYKNDLSDIIGILSERQKNQSPISINQVKNAFEKLYGSYDLMPQTSKVFLQKVFQTDSLSQLYNDTINKEKDQANDLLEFQEKYPNVVNEDNAEEILANLRSMSQEKDEKCRVPSIAKSSGDFGQSLNTFAQKFRSEDATKPSQQDCPDDDEDMEW